MAFSKGIDALEKELNTLKITIAEQEARFDTFRREHPYAAIGGKKG